MSHATSPSSSMSDIKALLAEFDSSGQRVAEFARSKGIPPWRLYGAPRRRNGQVRARDARARAEKPVLLPVHLADVRPARERPAWSSCSPVVTVSCSHPTFDVLTLCR